MKRKPFQTLLKKFLKNPSDSVAKRKAALLALTAITPETEDQHNHLCMCLKNLEFHESCICKMRDTIK